ncbi:MAG: hypothetical protein WC878_07085 [Candidatus Paceibacterota bacterium]|jgi:putative Ca2+/H+ antiporter (TMEM165/GDT1 family)
MFFGLSAAAFVSIVSALCFFFLFAGIVGSFCSVFWPKKIRWVFSSLCFLASAVSFLVLSYYMPVFVWDTVPVAIGELVLFFLCLKAGF